MTDYRKHSFGAGPSRYVPIGVRGSARKGNSALGEIKQALKGLPTYLQYAVANRAATHMTELARQSYESGRTAYDDPRPRGVDGRRLSLVESGGTKREIRFRVVGTQVRCDLGADWRKYLIGKYGILPNGSTPARWNRELDRISAEEIARVTGGA